MKIILPRSNRKDVEHDVPPEIIKQMEFVYAVRVEDALDAAFGPGAFHSGQRMPHVESRL
jgi:ATP-dependent Lon protease